MSQFPRENLPPPILEPQGLITLFSVEESVTTIDGMLKDFVNIWFHVGDKDSEVLVLVNTVLLLY